MNVRFILRASTVCVVLATTSVSSADDAHKKEAQALFEMGVKQADAGDSAAALSSFRAAYEKAPNYRVLYNIGKLCSRIGDAACAVRAYEQYLHDGGSEVPAKRRKEIESDLKGLTRTIATVVIKSNVRGAEVLVDDVSVGKTPFSAPVPVNGGSHKIVLVREGGNVEKRVTVVAGESATVKLDAKSEELAPAPPPPEASGGLTPEPEAEPAPKPKAKDPEPDASPPARRADADADKSKAPRSFPVVPWAITGALAAATAVTGVLAANAYGDFKDKRDQYPITRDDLDSAQGKARDLFLLSGLLGAGTLVSLGVASYVTFFNGPSSGASPSKGNVGLVFGLTSLGVRGVIP